MLNFYLFKNRVLKLNAIQNDIQLAFFNCPRLFAVVDDIFCIFEGNIENIGPLKQQYGLNKTANEVTIIIEAYKTLRDRGPYPADQVVRDLRGKFAFILYDISAKVVFVAAVSISNLTEFRILACLLEQKKSNGDRDYVIFLVNDIDILIYILKIFSYVSCVGSGFGRGCAILLGGRS